MSRDPNQDQRPEKANDTQASTKKSSPQDATHRDSERVQRDGEGRNEPRPSAARPGDSRPGGSPRENVDSQRDPAHQGPGRNRPQYDDRPAQPRGGDDVEQPGSALPRAGQPNYGDQEPSDPRRLDVDAGGAARQPNSGGRPNPSKS